MLSMVNQNISLDGQSTVNGEVIASMNMNVLILICQLWI